MNKTTSAVLKFKLIVKCPTCKKDNNCVDGLLDRSYPTKDNLIKTIDREVICIHCYNKMTINTCHYESDVSL